MNILFCTLLYPPETLSQVSAASKAGLQNQINNFQWALIDGIQEACPDKNEQLEIVNSLPVGIFPVHYRHVWLPQRSRGHFTELGSINLPWLKQHMRQKRAERVLRRWLQQHPSNRHILVYSLYLPYMKAVAKLKKEFPTLKATIIITDLPNELGISSGRKHFLKWLEYRMGAQKIALCSKFDGCILLTAQMAEALPNDNKAKMVLEGLTAPPKADSSSISEATPKTPGAVNSLQSPMVLYTGTINRELGIGELLDAFRVMPDCQLILCGKGDMEDEAVQAAAQCANIHYLGFVSQAEALALQQQADMLINPRSEKNLFTRYSFPSKTLEYMRSGKPTLCYPLSGIPNEYNPYLFYITKEGASGITEAVQAVLNMPPVKREQLGQAAKHFAEMEKGHQRQSQRVVDFLRNL